MIGISAGIAEAGPVWYTPWQMFSVLRSRLVLMLPWGVLFLLGGTGVAFVHAAEIGADPSTVLGDGQVPLETRQQALEELERLGQQAHKSTPELIELISSTTSPLDLRRRAVLVLATIGFENREQAQVLFNILANPEAELELRRTIIMAFAEKDLFSSLLVPALLAVVAEPRDEPLLRRQALFALRRFGTDETVLPALSRVFAVPADDVEFRLAILDYLRTFNHPPRPVIASVAALAQSRDETDRLRTRAIETLRGLGPDAGSAAAALVGVVSDTSATMSVRLSAASALRQTGWSEEDSLVLIRTLFAAGTPVDLSTLIAGLLAMSDHLPTSPPNEWRTVLETRTAPLPARRIAARMLARADPGLAGGIDLSSRLLSDSSEDIQIRLAAGEFLRRTGVQAAPARETLETILLNGEAPAELRQVASAALAQVAQTWLERPDLLSRTALNSRLASLDHVLAVMEQAGLQAPPHPQNVEAVRRMRDVLRAEKEARWWSGLGDWAETHAVAAWWIGGVVIFLLGCGMLLAIWWVGSWIAPLALGRLHERMRRFEVTLPGWLGGRSVGLRYLSLLFLWRKHGRVLNAWSVFLCERVSSALRRRRQQANADIFLDLPILVDGEVYDNVPFELILDALVDRGGGVLIAGNSGTGKTSLAWQIADRMCSAPRNSERWRPVILPIWFEPPMGDKSCTGLEMLSRQYRATSAQDEAPSDALLQALLERGRIALFLDDVSEWSATDRDQVIPHDPWVKAPILVTTRCPDFPAGRRPLKIEIPRLRGSVLARFVECAIKRPGREFSLGPNDVVDVCRRLDDLTAGRGMTADGAQWFLDFLNLEKSRPGGLDDAENVLDLVRDFVRQRNGIVKVDRLPEELALRLAGELAWACLARGGSAVLSDMPKIFTPQFISYFETQLGLTRIHPGTGRIRFLRHTVAEYLAAGHLIDTLGKDEAAWTSPTGFSPGPASGEAARTAAPPAQLFEALWNACFQLSDPFAPIPVPPRLYAALEQRMQAPDENGLRPSPRAHQLARLVLAPENPERKRAIDALVELGTRAMPVLPELLNAFHTAHEDLEIRHAALAVFSLLGEYARPAVPELRRAIRDRKEHLFLRLKAIDVLVQAAPQDAGTVQLLVDRAQDPAEIGVLRARASQIAASLKMGVEDPAAAADHDRQVRAGK